MIIERQLIHQYLPDVVCLNCRNLFNSRKYGKGKIQKYCSKSCSVIAQHKRKEIGFENHNPNYIDGRSKKVIFCKCGKKISDYRGKLCQKCYLEKLIILNKTLPRYYTEEYRQKVRNRVSGNKSNWWKGDEVGYKGIHIWLSKKFGKAIKCENKSCKKLSNRFQWALLKNKKYKRKRENFIQLCISCHKVYDSKI